MNKIKCVDQKIYFDGMEGSLRFSVKEYGNIRIGLEGLIGSKSILKKVKKELIGI